MRATGRCYSSPPLAGDGGVCGCIRALPRSRYMQWPPRVVACPTGRSPLCARALTSQSVSHSRPPFALSSTVAMDEQPPLLALPAPEDVNHSIDLNVSTGEAVVMDHLGPVIVNADGTLARIANWEEMTDKERQLTKKRIAKRNVERLRALSEAGTLSGESVSALASAEPATGPIS